MRRQSGIAVPLFALTSSSSWGIGEFADLPVFAKWAAEAGQSLIQVLPIHEMPAHERSPYSAMTAMALDPIYISMTGVADFESLGAEFALERGDTAALDTLRRSSGVRYAEIRRLKEKWLRKSWDRFLRMEVSRGTTRAQRLNQFIERERWWLDDYALFRSLHALHDELEWQKWPEPLSTRDRAALTQARQTLHPEISYRQYVQWIAAEQWAEARRLSWPTHIFGDLPFMLAADSADVWARQDEFRFDATIGVPPDAFSETGQDWGLPPWRREVMAANDFAWMRARAKRYADLFDGYRIDHLVGLYRTYIRPLDKSIAAFFDPAEQAEQTAMGERLISIFTASGAGIIAEDLGVIPAFVRESLARLGLPGLKVMRWERQWDQPGTPLIDPRTYPELSVATTGTHDIEPLAATPEGQADADREAIVKSLIESRSVLALIPLQDVFGWTDRINTPAVVDMINWTWRLPWPVDTWLDRDDTVRRADQLREWTRAAGR
jgi:4-alpha-glucanotransferase